MMFTGLECILFSLAATVFTWFCTALGASAVFFFGDISNRIQNALLGFSAGVMIAASFWSLLEPCVEYSNLLGQSPCSVMIIGFVFGVLLLYLLEFLYPANEASTKRSHLLMLSITLHNIPEGLCVGVAFGYLCENASQYSVTSAVMLALGIGIQNIPEGSAVSLPLLKDGYSKPKAFFIGQLSAFVEVIAGVIGCAAAISAVKILPYLLSFAAGAMIYVTISDLIPESHLGDNKKTVNIITVFGFILMSALDVLLG